MKKMRKSTIEGVVMDEEITWQGGVVLEEMEGG